MPEANSRRQSRGKQPKSYRIEDEYSFLDDEAGSAASGARTPDVVEADEDGDDFMPDAEEEPEDDFDEALVEEGDSDEEYSDGGRPPTPELDVVELDSVAPAPAPSNNKGNKKRKAEAAPQGQGQVQTPTRFTKGGGVTPKAVGASQLRTRGVADFTKAGGQEVRLRDLYGHRNEDLMRILSTRDNWQQQVTLPLRKLGGLRRSFFEDLKAREDELRTTKEWYRDIGNEVFAKVQKSEKINEMEAKKYMQNAGPESLNILMGPIDAPEVYTMDKLSYINVAKPFKEKRGRHGWLLNLGSRIQDAHWAAVEEGKIQYLAVAVEQKGIDGRETKTSEIPKAPAFSATEPFAASIQIWAFEASENGKLDSAQEPRLQIVLCTEWGAPKQLRWCPVGIGGESDTTNETSDTHIGLLAATWSDGHVRLLDVSYPKETLEPSEPHYIHIRQAAFDVGIPQTVPSCLHWLSGTTLAVATAAGTLAIWTFDRSDTLSLSQKCSSSPKPWFYQQMADTYILTLSSGWPSQPQFISITTADGFARLYDIRTPNADNTASIRGRTLCITQAWHEHTQAFIMPDEHYMLKHNPIRRFYHNLYSMRAESSITRVASSLVHPGVLIGGADGRVEASNPVSRICNYKTIPWQQTWFAHEWRGPVDKSEVDIAGQDTEMREDGPAGDDVEVPKSDSNTASQSILSQPLVRITEGYKAVQPGIQHSVVSKKQANPEIGKGITIYEEPSAITVLAWNSNLKFGSWAVAGMGSGLLRVEDVGV